MPNRSEPSLPWWRVRRRWLPAAAALLAALGLWFGRDRLASCGGTLESPETQIRRALAHQDQARLEEVYGFRAGGTVELTPLRYAEIISSLEGDRATVVALLETEGRVAWRDQSAALSYLGREKFHLRPCSMAVWCAEGDQFARLRGVLRLLLRRHDAFEAGEAQAYAPLISDGYHDQGLDKAGLLARLSQELRSARGDRQRIQAWQIRVDRDGAEVGEDYLSETPGQPPHPRRSRYTLAWEGERWVFAGGL